MPRKVAPFYFSHNPGYNLKLMLLMNDVLPRDQHGYQGPSYSPVNLKAQVKYMAEKRLETL